MNGSLSLLEKYGSLIEQAVFPSQRLGELAKRTFKPPSYAKIPQFFTAEEAREFNIDLEPGWMLKVTPGADGAAPSLSYITSTGWEITRDRDLIAPEGTRYTQKEYEAQLAETEATQAEVERVFGRVFPEEDIEELLAGMAVSPEMPVAERMRAEEAQEAFLEALQQIGRTEDTEALVGRMFPGIAEESIAALFAPSLGEVPVTEVAKAGLAESWKELTGEDFDWGKLKDFALSGIGTVGAYIQTYIMTPWESMILDARARFQIGIGLGTDADREFLRVHGEIIRKYGYPAAFFADEYHEAFQAYLKETPQPLRTVASIAGEWLNPAWFIPIGGTFGAAAGFTSKVPILGKVMTRMAAGVQAAERGIMYPAIKPLELGAKGLEKAGTKLGEKVASRVIKESDHLILEIPESERILNGVLVDNWMKRTLTIAAKVPPIRKGIEKGLGWRILVKRQGKTVEDIMGRAAVVHAEIGRMGMNAKVKVWELRNISDNPVKLFGFNKKAYSPKMVERLLPEHKGLAEAGTLEHVFTKPEMYRLTPKQADYVTRVHELNTEVLNLLKKEGVAPENVTQDWWIHRVVTGKFDPQGELIALRGRPGVKGKAIGAKPSFEMHRKAPTMQEGIAWGIQYARDPELAITSYIEEAFNKIANERFLKYIEPFGILPSERLAERFPELVERAMLTQTELADAAKFGSLINRAIRGEKLPEQTLRAIERRFPDLGRRFRALAQEPIRAEGQLREILAQNEKTIRALQKRLEKAEAVDIEAIKAEARAEAIRIGIPDEHKLREAFQLMDFEDRLAFRSTMEGQLDDVGRVVYEQEAELVGLTDYLSTEPARKLINLTKKVGWYKGEVSNLTIPQYRKLTGKSPSASSLTKDGKHVKWEYALDDAATEMGYKSGEELKYAIEKALETKTTIEDLKILVTLANNRNTQIKRMMGILDNVDTKPEFIPKAEIRPVEAVPKAERIAVLREDLARLEKELAERARPAAIIKKQIESVRAELS